MSGHKRTLLLSMMASLWPTSSANTASRAPTYIMFPSLLSRSVVVLLTSWLLKWLRRLPGLPVSQQLRLELGHFGRATRWVSEWVPGVVYCFVIASCPLKIMQIMHMVITSVWDVSLHWKFFLLRPQWVFSFIYFYHMGKVISSNK